MLVGDAARQVNPLSGGGIASGMIGGKIAGTIAAEAIKMNKLDHILTYDKAWSERLGKRHETFNRIKEGIYNFSDEKFNNIAHAFNKIPYEKERLEDYSQPHYLTNRHFLLISQKFLLFNHFHYYHYELRYQLKLYFPSSNKESPSLNFFARFNIEINSSLYPYLSSPRLFSASSSIIL